MLLPPEFSPVLFAHNFNVFLLALGGDLPALRPQPPARGQEGLVSPGPNALDS